MLAFFTDRAQRIERRIVGDGTRGPFQCGKDGVRSRGGAQVIDHGTHQTCHHFQRHGRGHQCCCSSCGGGGGHHDFGFGQRQCQNIGQKFSDPIAVVAAAAAGAVAVSTNQLSHCSGRRFTLMCRFNDQTLQNLANQSLRVFVQVSDVMVVHLAGTTDGHEFNDVIKCFGGGLFVVGAGGGRHRVGVPTFLFLFIF